MYTLDICETRNIGLPFISENGTVIYNNNGQITENDIRREIDGGTRRLTAGNPNS